MRVAVLGGGYAGLLTAKKLESTLPADVELVLVDDTGEHLVQHELHRAIRAPEFVDAISIPLHERSTGRPSEPTRSSGSTVRPAKSIWRRADPLDTTFSRSVSAPKPRTTDSREFGSARRR